MTIIRKGFATVITKVFATSRFVVSISAVAVQEAAVGVEAGRARGVDLSICDLSSHPNVDVPGYWLASACFSPKTGVLERHVDRVTVGVHFDSLWKELECLGNFFVMIRVDSWRSDDG